MMSKSSLNCNQTHIQQLLDLLHYYRILYVSTECLGVLLHLLQDEPRGQVTHLLHLGHGPSLHIFRAVMLVVQDHHVAMVNICYLLTMESRSSAFWQTSMAFVWSFTAS